MRNKVFVVMLAALMVAALALPAIATAATAGPTKVGTVSGVNCYIKSWISYYGNFTYGYGGTASSGSAIDKIGVHSELRNWSGVIEKETSWVYKTGTTAVSVSGSGVPWISNPGPKCRTYGYFKKGTATLSGKYITANL